MSPARFRAGDFFVRLGVAGGQAGPIALAGQGKQDYDHNSAR
jgi:hypothetical protein